MKHFVHFRPLVIVKFAFQTGSSAEPHVQQLHIDTFLGGTTMCNIFRCVLYTVLTRTGDGDLLHGLGSGDGCPPVPSFTAHATSLELDIRIKAGVAGAGRFPAVAGRHPPRIASATVFRVCNSVTLA